MAQITLSLNVEINPEAINEIKRALYKDISEVAEKAYKEGYVDKDPSSADPDKMQEAWEKSETKQKLDNFLKS